MSGPAFRWLLEVRPKGPDSKLDPHFQQQIRQKIVDLLQGIRYVTEGTGDVEAIADEMCATLTAVLTLPRQVCRRDSWPSCPRGCDATPRQPGARSSAGCSPAHGKDRRSDRLRGISQSWIDEWLIGRHREDALYELGVEGDAVRQAVATVKLMIRPSALAGRGKAPSGTAFEPYRGCTPPWKNKRSRPSPDQPLPGNTVVQQRGLRALHPFGCWPWPQSRAWPPEENLERISKPCRRW